MAEGRMLKKRISRSKKFASLKSDRARMLYLMIYPHTDIRGRMESDPDLIKSQVVPRLSLSERQIMEYLLDLASVGLILLWRNDGDLYLEITRFEDFQSLREDREAPSVIDDPTPEQLQEYSCINPGELPFKGKDKVKVKVKVKYKECVFLVDGEYENLIKKIGKEKTEKAIEILNNYKMAKGKKYKSDYHAILNWVINKIEKEGGHKKYGIVDD